MNQKEGIPIGEHILRTTEQMKKIMGLSVIVIPKLFDAVRKYKEIKKKRELVVNEDMDWEATTDQQGIGNSIL